MTQKNLVVVCAGENSLHQQWIQEDSNFDLIVLYYGNCDIIFNKFVSTSKKCLKVQGHKYHLIYNFIKSNLDDISQYKYVWFPDDDLMTSSKDITSLFNFCINYELMLASPSLNGHISHQINKPHLNNLLRFTNFVEVICPIMAVEVLLKIYYTFTLNDSSWGLDFLWPKLLGYPKNKIAIIDSVPVTHTRPVGTNYSRFATHPLIEIQNLFKEYELTFSQHVYSSIPLGNF